MDLFSFTEWAAADPAAHGGASTQDPLRFANGMFGNTSLPTAPARTYIGGIRPHSPIRLPTHLPADLFPIANTPQTRPLTTCFQGLPPGGQKSLTKDLHRRTPRRNMPAIMQTAHLVNLTASRLLTGAYGCYSL